MVRTLIIFIAVIALAVGLRRVSNVMVRYRRRRAHRSVPRFQATVRCVRCGAHLAPGVRQETANGPVCDTPGCHGHDLNSPNSG